jgi:hypothetical protein
MNSHVNTLTDDEYEYEYDLNETEVGDALSTNSLRFHFGGSLYLLNRHFSWILTLLR